MRISVDEADPGYHACLMSCGARVYLDGCELSNVVTADDEAGEVVIHVTNSSGCLQLAADGQSILQKTLRGQVKVVLPYAVAVEILG